jgi:transcriptional regulator with XRE-family HTH domain
MENKHREKYLLIGKAISEERKMKGLSQQDLAEKIGVSKSYISKIEAPNYHKSFSLEVLFDIADALDISVVDLFKYLK